MKNKNIYVLPTDKPSKIINSGKEFNLLFNPTIDKRCVNIYITSDEKIGTGEYYLGEDNNIYCLVTTVNFNGKKIILTTNQNLIKNGIQAIDDKFIEWLCNNPSCEWVEVQNFCNNCGDVNCVHAICHSQIAETKGGTYKTIIPKKSKHIPYEGRVWEPNEKEENLIEEAAEKILLEEDLDLSDYDKRHILKAMVNIAKWQAERMYSEEDMRFSFEAGIRKSNSYKKHSECWEEWIEQFKRNNYE